MVLSVHRGHCQTGGSLDADGELRTHQRNSLPVTIGYVIAILVGLALPGVAVALYFALAVYLVVPFRPVARRLFRRHRTHK
jgi:hypothetical protein